MMIRQLAFSTEPWALDILSHATVLIVPSFNGDGRAANTRGNATGQDLNRDHWSEAMVNEKLHGIMVQAFDEVHAMAGREGCDMRTAAYLVAVERVGSAMAMRGLYP